MRSSLCRLHLPLQPELDDAARHGLRLLDMRKMARLRDRLERRTGYRGAIAPAVFRGRETVARAPQEENRHADAMQPVLQLRVVHVRIPGKQRGRFAIA